MVNFDGYLTGSAEQHFHKRSRILGQGILLLSIILITPGILRFAIRSNDWTVVTLFVGVSICVMLLPLIPKSKKERKAITPKRIVVEDEYIVCVAEKYTEIRMINDVRIVRDFGEYYELCFPFGKFSDKFICQKSLLTNGSIQEFEAIFSEKITKGTRGRFCVNPNKKLR